MPRIENWKYVGSLSECKRSHSVLSNNWDVVCITETWLNDSFFDNKLSDPCYLVFRNDKKYTISIVNRGGGVLCCVKAKFKPVLISKSINTEFQWLSIEISMKDLDVMICCVFITTGANLTVYEQFYGCLETCNGLNAPEKLLLVVTSTPLE
ncbi:hypothetical protein JTB14_019646 [Gonioctena quinquepunctata]|nr:hypothetical protein JTB14_019646 [Gonioctena quinquepunctata]